MPPSPLPPPKKKENNATDATMNGPWKIERALWVNLGKI